MSADRQSKMNTEHYLLDLSMWKVTDDIHNEQFSNTDEDKV